MDASLPQSSALFVDHLITQIAQFKAPAHSSPSDHTQRPATHPEKQPQNALARLPPSELARIKPLILTLHCLFPNDLLPALDILDRGLVQRLVYADTSTQEAGLQQSIQPQDNQPPTNTLPGDEAVFLVISASTEHPQSTGPSSTPTTQDQEKGYEVRLRAWSCTCPIFTLSAFRDPGLRLDPPTEPAFAVQGERWHDQDEVVYPFGGTLPCATERASPPVCKHILACILFARCSGLFGCAGHGCRLVGMDEVAGWCAGWGG